MALSKKIIDEFKEIYRRKEGEELSDTDAQEAAQNLTNYVELVYDLSLKEVKRQRRLKNESGGFPVDGSYSCLICGESINENTGWYDWYGQTCLICRKAILDGTVPTFICKQNQSYFSMWQLKSVFNIHPQTARKYIREKKLIAREIKNEVGDTHEYIFLKKENPGLVERYSPERKSYDRHREKVSKEESRKWKEELLKKFRVTKKNH